MSIYTAPHQAGLRGVGTHIPKVRDDTKLRSPRACMILASTGLEPIEVHEIWEYLTKHGFFVEFATWDGKPALADPTLLKHTLWGSSYALQEKWATLITLTEWLKPLAWAPVQRSYASSATETTASTESPASSPVNAPPKVVDLEQYDLVFIPGGWATREHLENDTKLHEILAKYCLNLPRKMGSKVLAVVGDGISPLLHVKDPLTQEPILKGLESTGPGYDSWTGLITGKDLGSLIPRLVKRYVNKKVTIDPDNWYISSPSSGYNKEFCHAMVVLVYSAVRVSELRKAAQDNKRLSTLQTNQLETALQFNGLTERQKERLDSDGIGYADSGFVMTNWSWGWRKNLN